MLAQLVDRFPGGRALWLGELFHEAARRHPGLPIHLDHQLHCGFAEVPEPVSRFEPSDRAAFDVDLAARLVEQLSARMTAAGLHEGRYVAIYHADSFDIPLLAAAVSRGGGVPVLLSPYLPPSTAVQLVAKLGDPTVIVDGNASADLRARFAEHGPVWHTDRTSGLVTGAGAAHPVRRLRRDPDRPMLVTHTSGTTRLPKLTVHTARSLWYRVAPQRVISLLLDPASPAMFSITLVHTRFYMALGMFLWHGKPLIIACDNALPAIAQTLHAHRPDYLETHPNTFVDWEPLAEQPSAPLRSVKIFHAAFDAIHPRTMRVFLQASGSRNARFFRFYGQSEVGPSTGRYYTRRNVHTAAGQCVGWPIPGFTSVRIVDDLGNRVRRGQAGHIEVDSRSRILTYLGDEQLFERNRHGSWWDTGDLGHLDRFGRLHLHDRQIDTIDAVGSALYYEDILMESLPAAREAVITELSGTPVALVSAHDDRQLDLAQATRILATVPGLRSAYLVRHEMFPVTATRKVQRPLLKERLADRRFLDDHLLAEIDLTGSR
ncbi:MAG TPA: class I adenylate-forming enzyme family protein [Jatrophihabitans sp.]|nr:class I adenylate-forming enzyme family protein [Jatrophihabitans sp.]